MQYGVCDFEVSSDSLPRVPLKGPSIVLSTRNQAQLARPETSLNFFLTGGLRPPDPPISRPGGLPIWSLTGFGQPNKSLNFVFAPDGKVPGNC